jgi:predicted house-cleaning noncanonical NTP pyrophosphatase (MazG superfamily)
MNKILKEASLNKLVRDKLPEILESEGAKAEVYKVADDQIFKEVLLSKLEEEALEANEALSKEDLLETLGDIETVINGLLELNNYKRSDLAAQQVKKEKEVGSYSKRLILKIVRKEE